MALLRNAGNVFDCLANKSIVFRARSTIVRRSARKVVLSLNNRCRSLCRVLQNLGIPSALPSSITNT